MRTSRLFARVSVCVLLGALVGLTPAHAAAPAGDPLAATVTGACAGGPGRMSLTVQSPTAGKYQVEVRARGFVEGSRWTVEVAQESGDGARFRTFRRVAVDGGWTVETRFPTSDSADETLFSVRARERGDRGKCTLLNQPEAPFIGLSQCDKPRPVIALFARDRDNDSTLVNAVIFGARPDSRWHLALTATGAASRQVVEFDDHASRRRVVESRAVLTGIEDPRLRLVATNRDQGRCLIAVNPPNVTTDAPLKLPDLGRLSALRG